MTQCSWPKCHSRLTWPVRNSSMMDVRKPIIAKRPHQVCRVQGGGAGCNCRAPPAAQSCPATRMAPLPRIHRQTHLSKGLETKEPLVSGEAHCCRERKHAIGLWWRYRGGHGHTPTRCRGARRPRPTHLQLNALPTRARGADAWRCDAAAEHHFEWCSRPRLEGWLALSSADVQSLA
jgi:hypothetical protein